MRKSKRTMTFYLLFFFFFLLPWCNCTDRLGEFCNEDKNTSSKQILANIDRVLTELASKTPSTGFITTSYGHNDETVYGLAQCRGDVSTADCSTCVNDSAKQIKQLCTNQADGRIWFDYCFLRYDVKNFIGEVDTGYGIFYWNVENATDPEEFVKKLGEVMPRVREEALMPANKGLGRNKTKFSSSVTIYSLVQCTRDLSQLSCAQCLDTAIANIPKFCLYKKGCRVLYSSCYLRYEIYPFFFPLGSKLEVLGTTSRAILHP
ncbi:hypothetical protein AAC387_Pa01g1522 [Persea americana]